MDDCLGQFSTDDMAMLESMIVSNYEDAVMISNLSKLQKYQLHIQEKLNQIFAESISTQPHFNKLRKQAQDAKWEARGISRALTTYLEVSIDTKKEIAWRAPALHSFQSKEKVQQNILFAPCSSPNL